MLTSKIVSLIILATTCLLPICAQADSTIIIIRHGEKPTRGLGQLSCMGLNRALALPQVLAKYGMPSAIYAPNPSVQKTDGGVAYDYVRPLATIEPTAIKAELPVNVQFGLDNTEGLSRLLAQSKGIQFVTWEHHQAVTLAKRLMELHGSNPNVVPEWDDQDFDWVYIIKILDAGAARYALFSREQEGLGWLTNHCPN